MKPYNENVIEMVDLWKKFPRSIDRSGFKEFLVSLPKKIKSKKDKPHFWALRGINFTVKKGECLGIIGKNGAGKSTLLSLILGTIRPTSGEIAVNKKITPLIALGAGFHPDLTGRENALINGVLLGFTKKEVLAKLDEIIDFSELNEFMDMPVRTYSNGMYLRLAFSIAIHTDPELLLIDEILSVGDEAFQQKSKKAILSLISSGVTTIIVSHSLATIAEICDRAIWINNGLVMENGDAEKVVDSYLLYSQNNQALPIAQTAVIV